MAPVSNALTQSPVAPAGRLKVSFEFFPPKTAEMAQNLWQALLRLVH